MMLRYMGLGQYAQRIEMACFDVIREGKVSVKFVEGYCSGYYLERIGTDFFFL